MRAISSFLEIYLCRHFVDFRKSIDGLSQIVEAEMSGKPFSGALFVFMGRHRDRVKILYWDKTGFALWYKRLEEAKFAWQKQINEEIVTITPDELSWLLSGVNIWKIKPHEALNFEKIA